MFSFSGFPLLCSAVLLLMGVIIFMVKQLFCFVVTSYYCSIIRLFVVTSLF